MTYKLLAVDLDGTLLDSRGDVHAEDREALLALRSEDVVVTICTGRLYGGSWQIAEDVGVTGAIACMDGSDIVVAADGTFLARHPIGEETLAKLEPVLASPNSVYVLSDRSIYYDARGDEHASYLSIWSQQLRPVDCVRRLSQLEVTPDISALVALGDSKWAESAQRELHRVADGQIQTAIFPTRRPELGGKWGLVIRRQGPDKGTALAWIAAERGLELAQCVAVGDWYNDVPMLRAAGRSFAMGQAPEPVRDSATDVLARSTAQGGGVAEAARRAGLL